jgi:hypothetical protein
MCVYDYHRFLEDSPERIFRFDENDHIQTPYSSVRLLIEISCTMNRSSYQAYLFILLRFIYHL